MSQYRTTTALSAMGSISSRDLVAPLDCDDTRRQIAAAIARLLLHYRGLDLPALTQELIAEDWLEDLDGFDLDIIRFACREWRQGQTRRPTPADIRLLVIAEHRRRNPVPEQPYIPPPPPRERTAEEIVEVELKMLAWRATLAETVNYVTRPFHQSRHEDPGELRRGRVELGLEPPNSGR